MRNSLGLLGLSGLCGGLLVGLTLSAGAQTLATGDSRTVTEPAFPAVCATVAASMAIVSGGPASETAFDTSRIQSALTACPSGQAVELAVSGTNNAFLIQPINIPSGVGLIVDGGVTVFASRNREDYQTGTISTNVDECGTQGPNGNGCKNWINFANGSTNVGSGIYGYGVLDARGYATTFKAGADTGISWWKNADVIANGYSQNNPIIMKLSKSTNFTLYKITIKNAPMFHVGWSGNGFTAWGVKIVTPFTVHNSDGIDPSGTNVTITNSSISDGDDDVAVGASSASSNITVSNVTTYSGHGISVGSYTQGGLTNFLVNNVNMAGTITDGNATGIRLKSALDRGGLLQTITYENMCVKDIHHILQFTPFYNTNTGTLYPQFKNIVLQNIHFLAPTGTQNPYLVQMQGIDANHISTITLNNVVFDQLSASNVTPTSQYDSFTLMGNVYPAFLQSLPGTGVSYTGTATATAGLGVSACPSTVFPYVVGELYVSTATGTSLQTTSISKASTVTLNAMIQPAMSTVAFSGSTGTWTGAATLSQPVNFYEGTTLVGSGTIGVNGTIASATLSGLTTGTHTYTAQYPGDANYAALTFGSVTVTVTSATTASTTVLTAPATGTFGGTTTLSAKVSGTGGTPTGTVAFYDGTNEVGIGTLAGGTATSAAILFTGGTHSLTAVYSGDTTFVGSTSAAATLTVAAAATTTTVTAAPTTVSQGQTTTLTAKVTGTAGDALPSGTVSFTDGTTPLGNATLVSGTATFTATMTTVGAPRTVTAVYSSDANYATSSGTVAVTVVAGNSTTTLTAPATAVYGVGQTLSAKVTATTGTPTGSVNFYDGANLLGTGTLTAGATTLTGQVLTGGTHSLTAVYSGDTMFPGSTSAAATLTVSVATSSTTLSISPTTAVAGAMVSLTATVNGVSAGVTPTGIVTFSDGATVLGTGVLTGNVATLAVGLPNAGARTITAVYSGDGNYATSSGTAAETVTALPTTTTLALSSTTAYDGGTVTLTATVAGATTGTVSFLASGAVVGTAAVSAAGVATFVYTLPASTVGIFLMSASYAANASYGASTSPAVTLNVGMAFQLTPSVSAVTIAPGASGTVTLAVAPGGGFTGAVGLSCSSPVKYVTCSVGGVTLSGTATSNAMATITVAATTSSLRGFGSGMVLALAAPFGLLLMGARRRRLTVVLVFGLVGAVVLGGCAGGTAASGTASNAPSGTQIVTFTATAAGITQMAVVTVTIH